MEVIMRAASDAIAQLAAAMAKAQSELINPVKSLTAVLECNRNGRGPISYKYAPLSSGLDIIRKTLGKYELTAIQTTHIDRERGLLLLTTTIAHASGEWISSIWPVCHIVDIGHPKLMGAALSYARRYCLFTIVGLAGEDDIEPPDLDTGEQPPDQTSATVIAVGLDAVTPEPSMQPGVSAEVDGEKSTSQSIEGNGVVGNEEASLAIPAEPAPRKRRVTSRRRPSPSPSARADDPGGDLNRITDADSLVRWALEILPARNKLDDGQRAALDAAFVARAQAIGVDPELLIPFAAQRAPMRPSEPPSSQAT
jgi:ERF superfamily